MRRITCSPRSTVSLSSSAAEIDQLHLWQLASRHPAGQPQMPSQTALDQR